MTRWLMVVAALLAVTPARAADPAAAYSANNILPGCVASIDARPNVDRFLQGVCIGILVALSATSPSFGACVPANVTVEQAMRVVIKYISARPERMHEKFGDLAREAYQGAWPCKPPPN